MKKLLLIAILLCQPLALADHQPTLAQALGWTKSSATEENICGGHYAEPRAISSAPTPHDYKKVPVHITAKGPVVFKTNGSAVLKDAVTVTQPGRLLTADKAIVFHNPKTGKITDVQLFGHVRLHEAVCSLALSLQSSIQGSMTGSPPSRG